MSGITMRTSYLAVLFGSSLVRSSTQHSCARADAHAHTHMHTRTQTCIVSCTCLHKPTRKYACMPVHACTCIPHAHASHMCTDGVAPNSGTSLAMDQSLPPQDQWPAWLVTKFQAEVDKAAAGRSLARTSSSSGSAGGQAGMHACPISSIAIKQTGRWTA